MTRLFLIATVALGLTACATRRISDNRIIKYEKEINEIASYMLDKKIFKVETDSVTDKAIKRKLNKLKIKKTEVFFDNPYDKQTSKDTVIQFNRWGLVFFSYYESVLLVRSKIDSNVDKDLQDWKYKKVINNIYYNNWRYGPM